MISRTGQTAIELATLSGLVYMVPAPWASRVVVEITAFRSAVDVIEVAIVFYLAMFIRR